MKIDRKALFLTTLAISVLLFVLGLVFPIMSTKKQIMGITLSYQDIRLLGSVRILIQENDTFLAVITLIVTFLFPCFKYVELLNRQFGFFHFSSKLSKFLTNIDKWSMLDVFIIALLLFYFSADSSFIEMKIRIGTYFLALSIFFRMGSVYLIRARKQVSGDPAP